MNKKYKVINEQNLGNYSTWSVIGFDTVDEAEKFSVDWKESMGYGYTPLFVIRTEKDGQIIVNCRCYNSCD